MLFRSVGSAESAPDDDTVRVGDSAGTVAVVRVLCVCASGGAPAAAAGRPRALALALAFVLCLGESGGRGWSDVEELLASESEGAAVAAMATAITCAWVEAVFPSCVCVTMIGGGFSFRARTVPEPPLAAAEALVGDCGGDWCSSASEARGDVLRTGSCDGVVVLTAEPEEVAGVSAEVRNQRETFSVTALELDRKSVV